MWTEVALLMLGYRMSIASDLDRPSPENYQFSGLYQVALMITDQQKFLKKTYPRTFWP